MQYTLARQWIADSINSITLEKFQLKNALVNYSEKTKKIQSKINYHKNNIENNPEGKLPLFTDLPPNHPEYLLPLATRIYALRYNALEINLEVIEMQNRLKLIQIEKNLFTKYQSNFDEKFTKLTAPNIQELSNSVLQKLKNTRVKFVKIPLLSNKIDLNKLMSYLNTLQINELLVEAGPDLNGELLKLELLKNKPLILILIY